jgi:hypothetical protein
MNNLNMHNMNTFTPQFRKAVESVAEEIGLLNATNPRHEKNGTIAYIDPVTSAVYTLHTNGYIRRTHRRRMWYRGTMQNVTYQLNPVRITQGRNVRIMMSPWEQLGKLTTSVISYRNGN